MKNIIIVLNLVVSSISYGALNCADLFSSSRLINRGTGYLGNDFTQSGVSESGEMAFSLNKSGELKIWNTKDGKLVANLEYQSPVYAGYDQIKIYGQANRDEIVIVNQPGFGKNEVKIYNKKDGRLVSSRVLGSNLVLSVNFADDLILIRNRAAVDESYYTIVDNKGQVIDGIGYSEADSDNLRALAVKFIAVDNERQVMVQGLSDSSIQLWDINKNQLMYEEKLKQNKSRISLDYASNRLLVDGQLAGKVGNIIGRAIDKLSSLLGSQTSKAINLDIMVDSLGAVTLVKSGDANGWSLISLEPYTYPWIKMHGQRSYTNYTEAGIMQVPGRVLGRSDSGRLIAVQGSNDAEKTSLISPPTNIEIYAMTSRGPKLLQTVSHDRHGFSIMSSVDFTRDGKRAIVSSYMDGALIISLETGAIIARMGKHVSTAGSDLSSDKESYVLSTQSGLEVYETQTGSLIKTIPAGGDEFATVKFINNRRILARNKSGVLEIFSF